LLCLSRDRNCLSNKTPPAHSHQDIALAAASVAAAAFAVAFAAAFAALFAAVAVAFAKAGFEHMLITQT
jgi:hypothetical protein